jgi:ligand-binding sensor domain-containing protein
VKLSLDALRAFDTPPPTENKDRLRTMPNIHSVVGVSSEIDLGDLKAALKLGYTENIFPTVPFRGAKEYHSNERINKRNAINVIMGLTFEGRRVTLFGHQNGLLVYDGSRWQNFTTAQGLSGRGVRGIAAHRNTVLLATDSGLSLVKLESGRSVLESLAKPINWKRFYSLDGLPHNETSDVFIDRSGTVWVGTKAGLARVPLAQITEKSAWKTLKKSDISALRSELITRILSDGTRLYLGTDKGLVLYELETGRSVEVAELRGQFIRDLALAGTTVYVATDRGIYELTDGGSCGLARRRLKSLCTYCAEFRALLRRGDRALSAWLSIADHPRVCDHGFGEERAGGAALGWSARYGDVRDAPVGAGRRGHCQAPHPSRDALERPR